MKRTVLRLGLIIAGIITITVASWAEFLVQKKHHLIGGGINRVFLFLLINAHFLIMGGLLYLIVRHSIKLFMERKHAVAGSTFTRNLVLSFMLFSVVPATFVVGMAGMVIIKSMNQWFQIRLDSVFKDTNKLHEMHTKQLRQQLLATGELIAQSQTEDIRKALAVKNKLTLYTCLNLDKKSSILTAETKQWRAFRQLNDRTTKSLRMRFLILLKQHQTGTMFDFFGSLYWVKKTAEGWIILAHRYPRIIRSALIRNEGAYYDYKMLRQLRESIQLSYVFSFALLVLLIIFLALWAAFYLARGITKPLAELLNATKRLHNGETGVTVPVLPQSDLQSLATAFNQMSLTLAKAQLRIQEEQKMKTWQEAAKQVAHEIKNPLTPIQLATERLQKKYGPQLRQEALFADCTSTIIDQVKTIKTLIDYFVQFASLPPVQIAKHNVAQLIEETYKLYRGSYPEITFSLTEKAPSTIFTDDHKIKQALINLIDNSIRAMNIAGTPKKEIVITLDTNAQNGCLQLAYSDNGPGIPAPLQDTLFLPYVSSDKKNLGLGLAIVHQIFKQLGGSIALNNSKQGAFFLCHLPQNNNA